MNKPEKYVGDKVDLDFGNEGSVSFSDRQIIE